MKLQLMLNGIIKYFLLTAVMFAFTSAKTVINVTSQDLKCGLGYDSLTGKIKKSPFIDIQTITSNKKQKIKYILKPIKNYQKLLKEIGIHTNSTYIQNIFKKSKKFEFVRKNVLNDYSIYYLLYVDIENHTTKLSGNEQFSIDLNATSKKKKKLKAFYENYGDSYIESLISGGEFIAVLRIETKSKLDYENVLKDLNILEHKWSNRSTIMAKLLKIKNKNSIQISSTESEPINILPIKNIEDLFKYAKKFPKTVSRSKDYYKATFVQYDTLLKKSKTYQAKKAHISKLKNDYLNYLTVKSNIDFIRTHHKQFRFDPKIKDNDLKDLTKYSGKIDKLSIEIQHIFDSLSQNKEKDDLFKKTIDNNVLLQKIKVPNRFSSSLPEKSLLIMPKKKFYIKNDDNNTKFTKINENTTFNLIYNASLSIENKGKVLLLSWNCKGKKNNRDLLFEESNSEILYDAYINFPGLRFESLKQNNYGTISANFIFNNYAQSTEINGSQIINKAQCGYNIGKEGELYLGCEDIDFKPLDINILHEEDFKKEPYIYNKPFSLLQ